MTTKQSKNTQIFDIIKESGTYTQSIKQPSGFTILDNLMDRMEFADAMGVTPRSTDRWAWQRKGPPRFKIGTKVYYDRADAEAYVQKLKQTASEGWGDL